MYERGFWMAVVEAPTYVDLGARPFNFRLHDLVDVARFATYWEATDAVPWLEQQTGQKVLVRPYGGW